jgi:threonine aldolase
VLEAEQVAAVIRKGTEHNPHTAVVAIENTHNAAGGAIFPLEEAQAISKICKDQDVAMHVDGARIFNAQAATGTPVSEWAACADTVTFCFSKGLGAPIGSMVCGSTEVVREAHRLRKRLGGGMRQVGVIAAAARVALETGPDRLHEDHANARRLAEGLAELNEECVDPSAVQTNMIYLNLAPFGITGADLAARLADRGIVTLGFSGHVMRLVTHRDVTSEDTERALGALRDVLSQAA